MSFGTLTNSEAGVLAAAKRWGSRTPADRFWDKVDRSGGPQSCWPWRGATGGRGGTNTYGRVKWHGRNEAAHRIAYQLVVGRIPDGLVIDHLCRVPLCVNPTHLEPVTTRENTLRGLPHVGRIRKTSDGPCRHGHAVEDIYRAKRGDRLCRGCDRDKYRRRVEREGRYWLRRSA